MAQKLNIDLSPDVVERIKKIALQLEVDPEEIVEKILGIGMFFLEKDLAGTTILTLAKNSDHAREITIWPELDS